VLQRVKEERNILRNIKRKKTNWICHILCRNCFQKHAVEEQNRRKDRQRYLEDEEEDIISYWMTFRKSGDTVNLTL
jgi:sulfatase maturation enzyme AslB (radical SAM superfamily)